MTEPYLKITEERLGISVEAEVKLAKKLGISAATIAFLQKKGNGKRGRPRKHFADRPATPAEFARWQREKKKAQKNELKA